MADLVTRILLDDKQFNDNIEKSKKQVQSYTNLTTKLGGTFGKLAGGIGVAVTASEAFTKAVNSNKAIQDKFITITEGAKQTVNDFFSALTSGDWSVFDGGITGAIKKGQQYISTLKNLKTALSIGQYTADELEAERDKAEVKLTQKGLSKEERAKAFEDFNEYGQEYINKLQTTYSYSWEQLNLALRTKNVKFNSTEDVKKAYQQYLDPSTMQHAMLEQYKKDKAKLESLGTEIRGNMGDYTTYYRTPEAKAFKKEFDEKYEGKGYENLVRFQNLFTDENAEMFKSYIDNIVMFNQRLAEANKTLADGKVDYETTIKEETDNILKLQDEAKKKQYEDNKVSWNVEGWVNEELHGLHDSFIRKARGLDPVQITYELVPIDEENPDIVERSGNPPILTGRVDKWIGYGSEPSRKDGKSRSFNEVRVKCINDAFSEEFDKWLQNNRYRKLNIDGKLCSIEEYVASQAVKKQIEIMTRDLTAQIKKRGRKEAEDYLGYNQRILASKKLYDKMYAAILKQARNYADEKAGINGQEPGNAFIDLRNGKTRTIYLSAIIMPFNEIIPIIIKEDLTFRRNVLTRIKKESHKEGVDLSKYCFDFDTRQNFVAMDNQIQTVNGFYNEVSQLATRKNLSKPRKRKPFESIFAYKDYLTQYSKKCQKAETKRPISQQAKTEPIKGMTEEEIRQSQIKLGFIKPDIEDKPYKVEREPQPYSLTRDEIIQDLPINSTKEQTFMGGMTDEEIRESQIKLGFIKPDIEDKSYKVEREPQPYSLTKDQIIQDLPIDSQEESTYSGGMTDEEIRESQIKLGFIKPDIEDKSYKVVRGSQPYSLTRNQIIQDLPINSTEEQTFAGGMTDEEIKVSQKKIGTYQQKRR